MENFGANSIYIDFGDRMKMNEILKKSFQTRNEFFIIDEADGFFPNKKELTKVEKRFIHIGRHYGLGAICTTRRLSNLHTDLVSQATKLFFFKLWVRADLQYLQESGLGDYIDDVSNLKKYEFLVIDNDTGENFVSDPL